MQQQDETELSDEQLVQLVCSGDRNAFRVLARRHGARYRALAYRFVADMALAEDLVQEAFVKLWTHADRFDAGKAKFTTWFHRVIVNKCLDEKRKRRVDPLPEGYDALDPSASAEERLGQDHANMKLKRVLQSLSERQKTAITLSYFDELSNVEAAEVMDLNIKAYESLLVRSRTKMRQALLAEKEELMSAIGRV
ncbi:MAG: sigma-70 family RNA polymerase sigma factor [Kordiimonas sp.]